jgi:hypothetical protein
VKMAISLLSPSSSSFSTRQSPMCSRSKEYLGAEIVGGWAVAHFCLSSVIGRPHAGKGVGAQGIQRASALT